MAQEEGISSKLQVQRRDDKFSQKIATRIWEEEPSPDNPYLARTSRCHGYDIFELMQKRSFFDVLYLLFKGELPEPAELELFEKLAIFCINPGPRHAATRAAMNAGVGKTDIPLILPISLAILGGDHMGAGEVEAAMRWLRKHVRKDPVQVASDTLEQCDLNEEGDVHISPGFGSHFGGIDHYVSRAAKELCSLSGAGEVMRWAQSFCSALEPQRMGWLAPGLVAAVLADLGFQPKMAPGIYQLISAPGLFAHGVEMASKPLTAMPFPSDSEYFIECGGKSD